MGDHQPSQEDGQQTASNVAPAEPTAAPSSDDKTVPLSELVKHRQEAARLKEEKRALEERLAALSKDGSAPKPANPPDTDIREQLQELKRGSQLRDMRAEHGLDAKQAESVLKLMESSGLRVEEALLVASSREPDLFATGPREDGFNPAVHGSGRPRPGSQPTPQQESDTPQRLKLIKQLRRTDKRASQQLFNNLIGSIAAEQVGKPGHERIPIPKTPE